MNNLDLDTIKNIEKIIILIFLIYAAYTDIKERKVTNKTNLSFLIIRILLAFTIPLTTDNLLGLVLGCITILVPAMILNKKAGGDIKLSAVLGFWLGTTNILKVLIVAVITALPIGLLMRKKQGKESIPFASNILLGFILIMLEII